MNDGIFPQSLFRPWAGNSFSRRADVEAGLKALANPVEQYRSPGGARIRLDAAAAHFDSAAADLEGFSRLLWGLVPAQVGGADWIDWKTIARGLAHGADPRHPEYWGDPTDRDQRLVELAAIGFALRLVPDKIWHPLNESERRNVSAYLLKGHGRVHGDNNWKFFRLMVGMGLRAVNVDYDRRLDESYIGELESYYLDGGWYGDGKFRRADHYIPFAFHYYGLILAALDGEALTDRYRERARLIARDISRWFADDGPALVFGRSMTYRFAIAGFFGALAVAGEEALPWGQLKGYYLRNLRWWAKQPMAARDNILPVGYAYPNLMMSEPYNSAQSPYWALKAFLPLMLPETHPFWASEEEPCPPRPEPSSQVKPGFLIANPKGDAIALSCGQQTGPNNTFIRCGPEKYSKFAYSARYGFSVETDHGRLSNAVLDSMIGFSEDGGHFRVREGNEIALMGDDLLYARWRPYSDVLVETWLYWKDDFHVRAHFIDTPRPLSTIEGGFSVGRTATDLCQGLSGFAMAETSCDISAIADIGSSVPRSGRAFLAPPNTNLIQARTVVPQLVVTLPAGTSTLVSAVIASGHLPLARSALKRLPACPNLAELRSRIDRNGIPVGVMTGIAH